MQVDYPQEEDQITYQGTFVWLQTAQNHLGLNYFQLTLFKQLNYSLHRKKQENSIYLVRCK